MIAALAAYRSAAKELNAIKEQKFPGGTLCRYQTTYVVIVLGDGCPPDKVACLFENGNTWWKPMEEVTPVRREDMTKLPRQLRRLVMYRAGYKTLPLPTRRPKLP